MSTSDRSAASPVAWSNLRDLLGPVQQALAVAEADIRKLRHDPLELLTRAAQPALWLLVFGQVFARIHGIPTGGMSYQTFLAPGILAQSTLFMAIFYGISTIWERDLGILYKYLVSPAPRLALVLGKALASGVRAVSQAIVVYVLVLLLGVPVQLTPGALAGVILAIILGAAVFSTFSLIIACLVKTRERFMGIGQVLTMPFFFASNALYPLSLMPHWLQVIARINPLTYQVDVLRALMVQGGHSVFGLAPAFGWQAASLALLAELAAWIYPRILY